MADVPLPQILEQILDVSTRTIQDRTLSGSFEQLMAIPVRRTEEEFVDVGATLQSKAQ